MYWLCFNVFDILWVEGYVHPSTNHTISVNTKEKTKHTNHTDSTLSLNNSTILPQGSLRFYPLHQRKRILKLVIPENVRDHFQVVSYAVVPGERADMFGIAKTVGLNTDRHEKDHMKEGIASSSSSSSMHQNDQCTQETYSSDIDGSHDEQKLKRTLLRRSGSSMKELKKGTTINHDKGDRVTCKDSDSFCGSGQSKVGMLDQGRYNFTIEDVIPFQAWGRSSEEVAQNRIIDRLRKQTKDMNSVSMANKEQNANKEQERNRFEEKVGMREEAIEYEIDPDKDERWMWETQNHGARLSRDIRIRVLSEKFAAAAGHGMEGVMIKDLTSPYEFEKSRPSRFWYASDL